MVEDKNVKKGDNISVLKQFRIDIYEIKIRKGPKQDFDSIGVARGGEIITISEQNGVWGKIANKPGWVSLAYATEIGEIEIPTAVEKIEEKEIVDNLIGKTARIKQHEVLPNTEISSVIPLKIIAVDELGRVKFNRFRKYWIDTENIEVIEED